MTFEIFQNFLYKMDINCDLQRDLELEKKKFFLNYSRNNYFFNEV